MENRRNLLRVAMSSSQMLLDSGDALDGGNKNKKNIPFTLRLHSLLDNAEALHITDIISWLPDGRAFKLHKAQAFQEVIMPVIFQQSKKLKSFHRQLNFYSITRAKTGPNKGCYSHPYFIRGQPGLCISIERKKPKGEQHLSVPAPLVLQTISPRGKLPALLGSKKYLEEALQPTKQLLLPNKFIGTLVDSLEPALVSLDTDLKYSRPTKGLLDGMPAAPDLFSEDMALTMMASIPLSVLSPKEEEKLDSDRLLMEYCYEAAGVSISNWESSYVCEDKDILNEVRVTFCGD